jgi:hypothetical protein
MKTKRRDPVYDEVAQLLARAEDPGRFACLFIQAAMTTDRKKQAAICNELRRMIGMEVKEPSE